MGKASVAASLWEQRVSELFGVEDARCLLSYRPRWLSEAVWLDRRELVFELLLLARLGSAQSALKSLGPLVHFVCWGHIAGLPRDVKGFYTAEHVEAWREVAAQVAIPGLSSLSMPSVSDYTSLLRQMGPKINPERNWPPVSGKRETRCLSDLCGRCFYRRCSTPTAISLSFIVTSRAPREHALHVENMNRDFLDPVVPEISRDVDYPLGLAGDDELVAQTGGGSPGDRDGRLW